MSDLTDLYRLMATSGTAPPGHLVEAVERAMLRDHGHRDAEAAARRAVVHGLDARIMIVDDPSDPGLVSRSVMDHWWRQDLHLRDLPPVMQVVCEPMLPKFPKLPDMPVTRADRRAASRKPPRRLFRP